MTRLLTPGGGLLALAVLLPAGLAAPDPADQQAQPKPPADERKALFDGGDVLDLAIDLGPKEADSLRREPRTYVRCTLKAGGKVVGRDVGVHLKGAAGSFQGLDDKPGLTLNMDKFAPGQKFRGLDKFHLANSVQDPSYVSELVCGELFRAAGVPAARVAHATVTLNGRRLGLYYLKEGYDADFLRAHFGTADGNLYDGGFLRDIDQKLDLISSRGDVKDQSDLKALLAASRIKDPAERFKALEKLLDLDRFLSYLALEMILADWDGYPSKCNNYRVYHDPKADKITFIPSGMDQVLGDADWPLLGEFGGRIARKVLDTPEGRKRYLARVAEVLRTVFKPDAIVGRLDELEKRLKPVLAEVDPGAAREYAGHVDRLREAVRERAKAVAEQLRRARR